MFSLSNLCNLYFEGYVLKLYILFTGKLQQFTNDGALLQYKSLLYTTYLYKSIKSGSVSMEHFDGKQKRISHIHLRMFSL